MSSESGEVTADSKVGAVISNHPQALAILIEAGFTPLANPALRRTLAQAVTLRQACSMHRIDLDVLLARLRRLSLDAKSSSRA